MYGGGMDSLGHTSRSDDAPALLQREACLKIGVRRGRNVSDSTVPFGPPSAGQPAGASNVAVEREDRGFGSTGAEAETAPNCKVLLVTLEFDGCIPPGSYVAGFLKDNLSRNILHA